MKNVKGFLATGLACGIKKSGKPDLALIYSLLPCSAAGVFTSNKMKAAPILVSMEQIKNGPIQAIVANSGNANCATGKRGENDAWGMVKTAAKCLGLEDCQVLVTSTGTIGNFLPMAKIRSGIIKAANSLSDKGAALAARAIMTTDRVPKEISCRVSVGKESFTIGAIAKGSGMLAPRMKPHATMHAFIATDAAIEKKLLQKALQTAVDESFNMVTVDNDMSTNDCVFVLANGMSGVKITKSRGFKEFQTALMAVCIYLAKLMALDGEGASRLIEVSVSGAKNTREAKKIARAVAGSALVKTAVYGGDPNFGRILAAAGAVSSHLDLAKLTLRIGTVTLFKKGESFVHNQKKAVKFLKKKEVLISLGLGQGQGRGVAWGCDLSYDYVKINARYHT